MNFDEFEIIRDKQWLIPSYSRYKDLHFKIVSKSKWNNCIFKCIYIPEDDKWNTELHLITLQILGTNRALKLSYSVLKATKKEPFLTNSIIAELKSKKRKRKPAVRIFRDFNDLTLNLNDFVYFYSYSQLHLGKIIYYDGEHIGIKRIKSKKRPSIYYVENEKLNEILKIRTPEYQVIKIQDSAFALLVQ